MRKIAIVKYRDCEDYEGVEALVAQSITDWSEVDDETYQTLSDYIGRGPRKQDDHLRIIELMTGRHNEGFIGRTVEEYRVYVEAELKRQAKKKAEMVIKKRIRTKAKNDKEREQYEALRKKFEGGQR